MTRTHFLLFAALTSGLLGAALQWAGASYGILLLGLGAVLLLACLLSSDRFRPYVEQVRRHSTNRRRGPKQKTDSPYGPILETEGWSVGPELDEVTARTLHAGEQTVQRMRRIAAGLEDDRVIRSIDGLCGAAEAIIERIRRHPERLSGVRRFFDYHLPATGSILNKYAEFLQSDVYTKEMEYQVKQIEGLLERIRRHFLKHLHRLVQDDLLDVEIEVNVFERVMRSEGL